MVVDLLRRIRGTPYQNRPKNLDPGLQLGCRHLQSNKDHEAFWGHLEATFNPNSFSATLMVPFAIIISKTSLDRIGLCRRLKGVFKILSDQICFSAILTTISRLFQDNHKTISRQS